MEVGVNFQMFTKGVGEGVLRPSILGGSTRGVNLNSEIEKIVLSSVVILSSQICPLIAKTYLAPPEVL